MFLLTNRSAGGARAGGAADGIPGASGVDVPGLHAALRRAAGAAAGPGGLRSAAGTILVRYGAAAVAVAIAVVATFALWQPLFSRNPFALFYAAVIVAAWYGGYGPGLLATALAAWAIQYFLLPSFLINRNGFHNLLQVGSFASIAVLVSSLDATRRMAMQAMRAAKESAEAAKDAADRARETAEAANRAKDDFLAVLSHELRTPLTPALAAAAAMETDARLPAAARADVAMIRRNIELEARLIDDLLDLTRITRGKLRLAPQPVDVRALAGHVLEICQADAGAKGLRVTIAADPACPPAWVSADPARLHQVLWNLVKNAVKFTPAGGQIHVRIGAEESEVEPGSAATIREEGDAATAAAGAAAGSGPPDAGPPGAGSETVRPTAAAAPSTDPRRLVIEVRDTGIGIAPHVLPRIFDAFEQGERTDSHRFGGLGLGLAITNALVAGHGGDLTAASDGEGRGATFTLRLPLVAAPRLVAAPATPPPVAAAAAGRLRVLLVEDHADTARVMARLLRGFGCDVRTAGSIEAALAAAAAGPFDLLVSDLGLPDGHGVDLIALLRRRHPAAGFRAIALSGYGMEDDLRRTREAGFGAHLTKPITFDTLEAAIADVLSSKAAA